MRCLSCAYELSITGLIVACSPDIVRESHTLFSAIESPLALVNIFLFKLTCREDAVMCLIDVWTQANVRYVWKTVSQVRIADSMYENKWVFPVIQACCRCCSELTAVLCCSVGTWRWSCLVASPLCVWWWSWARSCPHLPISSWHTAACVHSVWEVGITHEYYTQNEKIKRIDNWLCKPLSWQVWQVFDSKKIHIYLFT